MFLLSIKLALRNLLANKKQAFLTMLGVIIGVTSVITIMSMGAGAQSLIINQIKEMGTNLVAVVAGKSEEEGAPPPLARGIIITTLTRKDAEKLQDIPHVETVYAMTMGSANFVSKTEENNGAFQGVGYEFLKTHDFEVSDGRFYSKKDEENIAKVVVLGQEIKEKFFPNVNPIGQQIRIKNENFKIIGLLEERGTTLFVNHDNTIYLPVTSAQKYLLGIDYLHAIRLKVDTPENTDVVMNDIKKIMRRSHNIQDTKKDDFSVRSMAQALDVLTMVTDALKLFLASIGGIALIVGGIGIMNMMLITVTKRTREIGLRKTVGATKKDIIYQFLIESSTITFVGGLIGILLGSFFSTLIALGVQSLEYDWDLVISIESIVTASGVSLIIGIIFGLYPAVKAANLKPIEALRYQ